jgi:hypothetical protein
MAFLIDHWPMAYTAGEIASEFAATGMRIPNWRWCDEARYCMARDADEHHDYKHDAENGIDRWTYTPYGQVTSPRLAWLLKQGLVVKVPGINGGYNHWHADNDLVRQRVELEHLEEA